MVISNDVSLNVSEFLLQIKAIKLQPNEPFTWASGIKSPIYCDNRKILSYPKIRTFIRQEMVKMLEGNSRILEAQNNVLNKKIVKLEKKVTTTTHKDTLNTIAGKIVNINKTILQYKQALKENEIQISKLNANYKTDLNRFLELTK